MSIEVADSGLGFCGWLSQEPLTPAVIAIDMAWEGGSSQDPVGKEGLASFTASMLTEGAGAMDARAFHDALGDLAAHVSCSASRDYTLCRVRMLAPTRESVFSLLHLMLTQPRFDESAISRVRDQYHSDLRANLEDPSWLASQAFYGAAFPGHVYARPVDGTHASIEAITREDLVQCKDRLFARSNLKLVVVGPITRTETELFLKEVFSGLPEKARLTQVPSVDWCEGAEKHVDIPNPQTVCVFGLQAPSLGSPDYVPSILLNYILGGGGFSSRIVEEVREKRGLAYSSHTALVHERHMSGFVGSVGTQKARVAESLSVIESVLSDLARKGVKPEELEDAKKAVIGAYGLKFNSNQKKSGFLLGIRLNGFDPDYVDTFPELIEGVSQEDVQRVASQYLGKRMVLGWAGGSSDPRGPVGVR